MRAAREFVAKTLREHLPADWRIVDRAAAPVERVDRITVLVQTNAVRRAEQAPIGAYDTTVLLTLVHPNTDPAQAEPLLEDALEVLVLAIEDHLQTAWDEATKGLYQDTAHLAYGVPLHVITSRNPEE